MRCAASERLFALPQVWVIESSMEVVARQLLLLYLALMPKESVGNNGACEKKIQFIYCAVKQNDNEANFGVFPFALFREDGGFPGGVWKQRDPQSNGRHTETSSVAALSVGH